VDQDHLVLSAKKRWDKSFRNLQIDNPNAFFVNTISSHADSELRSAGTTMGGASALKAREKWGREHAALFDSTMKITLMRYWRRLVIKLNGLRNAILTNI